MSRDYIQQITSNLDPIIAVTILIIVQTIGILYLAYRNR